MFLYSVQSFISVCGEFYEITQNMLLLENDPSHRKIHLSHWENKVVFHIINKPWLLLGVAGFFFRTVFSVFSYSYFRSLKRSRHKSLRHFYLENKCHIKHSALLSAAFRQVRSHVHSQSYRQAVLMNPPNQACGVLTSRCL